MAPEIKPVRSDFPNSEGSLEPAPFANEGMNPVNLVLSVAPSAKISPSPSD